MPIFEFKGVDKSGKVLFGKMEFKTEGEFRMALREKGIRPLRITTGSFSLDAQLARLTGGGIRGVPMQVLVGFTRQLQVLVGSGVAVVQALEILSDQQTDKTMKTVIDAIRERVSQGGYLWESFGDYPQVFPKLYMALIRAGEASGSLDSMLKRLSRYLEDSERTSKMLKSAMMYPVIVTLVGSGVVALMLIFVIPKFEEMLAGAGQALPAPTQFVIFMSHFLARYIFYILGVIMGTVYLVSRYIKTEEGRKVKDQVLFRMPLFGGLLQKGGVARFARTLGTLLSSGVNLMDAVEICKMTIDNAVLEAAVGQIRAEIEQGRTLGTVLTKMTVFPRMAVQMISVGESTGNLDKMLEKVADFYEAEVEIVVGGMSKLIEPFILVFLGGTVGGMMIAMYMPIFKLAGGAGE
jgi:type IV pilus assembly protein PilC